MFDQLSALAQAKGHDGTDVGGLRDDRCTDVRLLDVVDEGDVRHAARIVHLGAAALFVINFVGNVGDGGNDVHVELPIQSLLHDFHVQQSQEAATETEAERQG